MIPKSLLKWSRSRTTLIFYVVFFSLSQYTYAQESPDSLNVRTDSVTHFFKLTLKEKNLLRYIGPGESIVYKINSDSLKHKHYHGVIDRISAEGFYIQDSLIAINDLNMIMSKGYRHARHAQMGMRVIAGSIFTISGSILMIYGQTKEKIAGGVGLILGVPLLIKSTRAYLVSNHYSFKKGWKIEVISFSSSSKEGPKTQHPLE